jgi:predicted nucleic acid-binding protein
MSYHLLDSDAVIDLLKGIAASATLLRNLRNDGHVLATSSVVIAEVWSGLAPADQQTGEEFLDALVFLPTSPTAGRQAGEWRYAYARQGVAVSLTDALIAATARQHNAVLVTGNVRDFPMPDVRLLPIPRPPRG